jgi:glutamate synthase (NADPH/NADH) small chain
LVEKPNSEKTWPCDLALLALGFTGPENTLSNQLGLEIDSRTNYQATNYQTNVPHIFTAGDMRRGQSLIVWAISEGREAAREVDIFLMGQSNLPTKGAGDLIGV